MTKKAIGIVMALGLGAGCGGSGDPGAAEPVPAREADATGAVATVDGDERQFAASVQEMLRAKVPGLQVMTVPGCGVTLRIRGMTDSLLGGESSCEREPLLIIDDMPVAPGRLADALKALMPVEIERVRVLKDVASTSVYGTRGANGVVIITTKH
ncbi:MAG: TonB-dependent receptor plug domain-containing protein [Gemmatimonadetes bacterium]|nr:TonB-dependent receptor plug domain-containing protein [Gemmatimonadota bacterium]